MKVLIAGGGDVAALIARRLIREGNEITIIEMDEARCAHLEGILDAHVVCGSSASLRTLRQAGFESADMLIAVTNSDEINILTCMAAQTDSRIKVKVARVRTHEVEDWRRICKEIGLHIDLIIHPETETATRLLKVLRAPGVSDIIDFAEGRIKMFGLHIEEGSWVAGKTLEELDRAGPPKNSLIALIFRVQHVIVPRGSDTLEVGDHVYVVTTDEELDRAMRFMGLPARQSLDRVFIMGGKQLSIWLAQELEGRGVKVKLFEKNAARCEKISGLLRKTIVIHGDGTDEPSLIEEHIDGVSAYLALTNDDEDNIIACLLARRLGARKVVALVNRLNYLNMSQRLGINTTISPRLVAVDRILQFVRKGRVLSVTTFREEEAEAIELMAAHGSKYVGKKLKDLRFPRGAIVGAIARPNGEVLIPRGEASIQEGDRVIFFTLESVVTQLESAFLAEPQREHR